MPFGGEICVELRANPIGPPASLCEWGHNRQTMPFKLGGERRLIGKPREMHAVQIDDDETVRISVGWLEYIAPVATKLDGSPGHAREGSGFRVQQTMNDGEPISRSIAHRLQTVYRSAVAAHTILAVVLSSKGTAATPIARLNPEP
jgi:hypothetical protein